MRKPFEGDFPITQIFNQKEYRYLYTKFGLLGHNGVDYGLPQGTTVSAPHSGTVIESQFDATGYGWYVKIESDKYGSTLGHFKEKPSVSVGQKVKEGDKVGLSGNTGNSTGPHLHWGFYKIPRNRDNGFNGYIDQLGIWDLLMLEEDLQNQIKVLNETKNQLKVADKALNDARKDIEELQNQLKQKDIECAEKIKKLQDALVTNKTPLAYYTAKEKLVSVIQDVVAYLKG